MENPPWQKNCPKCKEAMENMSIWGKTDIRSPVLGRGPPSEDGEYAFWYCRKCNIEIPEDLA